MLVVTSAMENASRSPDGKAARRNTGLALLIIFALALAALLIWRFYIAVAIVKLIFTLVFAPVRHFFGRGGG